MQNIIDDKTKRDDPLVKGLFYEQRPPPALPAPSLPIPMATTQEVGPIPVSSDRYNGKVISLKDGYGFIKSDNFPNNIFFYWDQLRNKDFNDLKINDSLSFEEGKGERGPIAMDIEVF